MPNDSGVCKSQKYDILAMHTNILNLPQHRETSVGVGGIHQLATDWKERKERKVCGRVIVYRISTETAKGKE
jgi:hypothetical protein